MLTFNDVKITKTTEDDGKFDEKKNKYVKYKKPIIKKKIVFDENVYDLGELYTAMKFACEQATYNGELSLTMTFKMEY